MIKYDENGVVIDVENRSQYVLELAAILDEWQNVADNSNISYITEVLRALAVASTNNADDLIAMIGHVRIACDMVMYNIMSKGEAHDDSHT